MKRFLLALNFIAIIINGGIGFSFVWLGDIGLPINIVMLGAILLLDSVIFMANFQEFIKDR